MYEYMRGKALSIVNNTLILEVSDIAYAITMPLTDLAEISEGLGKIYIIYIHFIHREDSMTLYGFLSLEGRNGFRTLLKVDGVGAKTAIAMLSKFSFEMIYQAIQDESVEQLKKIPGIGEKTAKKMILDLKGALVLSSATLSPKDNDLIEAMVSMGYNRNEVYKKYDKAKPFSGNFSNDIKKLLQLMG